VAAEARGAPPYAHLQVGAAVRAARGTAFTVPIRKILAPVVANATLPAPGHHVLTFHAPELVADARPGHFVAIAEDTGAQFLRRPFSLFTVDRITGQASILFSVYGPTSRRMATRRPGDRLDLIGPLGGRVFEADRRPGVRHVMVGGGYGVPPLVFLAQTILDADRNADVTFVNGARSRDFLVGTEGIEAMGARLLCATDDGSCGVHGRVTDVLETLLCDKDRPVQVYTCGPTPMMRAVGEMATACDVPCQVSLEVFMPCGIGICMGCAVGRPDGSFARGCFDGPVFDAREVVWE
jgi:dihydroorotate dehydrogenase electron transfer subunit